VKYTIDDIRHWAFTKYGGEEAEKQFTVLKEYLLDQGLIIDESHTDVPDGMVRKRGGCDYFFDSPDGKGESAWGRTSDARDSRGKA